MPVAVTLPIDGHQSKITRALLYDNIARRYYAHIDFNRNEEWKI